MMKILPVILAILTAALQNSLGIIQTGDGARDELIIQKKTPQEMQGRLGKALAPSMEMLDPKRHPKPKRPMGNDIGVARIRSLAEEPTMDHLETTISIGYTMSSANNSSLEEDKEISREMHDAAESVPTLSSQLIPNFVFHRDPEQEAINQRITEVARQLTETALRKQYEQTHLRHMFPLPADILRRIDPPEQETTTVVDITEEANETETTMSPETTTKISETTPEIRYVKLPKIGKLLPRHVPQLLEHQEIQSVPQIAINRAFRTTTSPMHDDITVYRVQHNGDNGQIPRRMPKNLVLPESERIPKNIAPPINQENLAVNRLVDKPEPYPVPLENVLILPAPSANLLSLDQTKKPVAMNRKPKELTEKSQSAEVIFPNSGLSTFNLPSFLKIVSPRYKFTPNDLVVSVPVGGGYLPAIVTGKNTWWTDPAYKEIVEKTV